MTATPLEQAAARLASARAVMVSAHRKPDGDAVGSMVALAALLASRGKQVTLYNPDRAPRNLHWLPGLDKLVHVLPEDARFDATVVVDTADEKMLGDQFPGRDVTGCLIALDHHSSARPYGDLYVCDPEAASVGVLVARLARGLEWPLPSTAAPALFVSLVSDTGSFRYGNTNAEALALAATLVGEHGVDPWHVHERMSERVPLSRYRLMAAVLGTLELACNKRVAFMRVTRDMVRGAKASWEDSEGLVNYARAVDGVECGVLLATAKGGGIRVSMRSKGHLIDAGAVCHALGGGGHRGAGGCLLPNTDLPTARKLIETALDQALKTALTPD